MNSKISRDWAYPFFTVWIGQAFSLFGSQLVQFALVWWLTKIGDSATVLAGATLVAMLPQIVLGPVAGALVDRWDRRRVMIAADGVIALATLALIYLFATDQAEIWHVYVIMLVRSAGGAFHWPAMQASTSLMVPEIHLARISGLNSALNGTVNIIAPPLGALLLELLPMQGVLTVDIVTASIAIGALMIISIPQPERSTETGSRHVWQDMKAGLDYVRGWTGLMILLLMGTIINFLLIPAGSLLPLLVKDYFGGEALEYSAMESFFAVGMLAGGFVLGLWGGFRRKIVTSQVGVVGIGLAHIVLGLAPDSLFEMALGAVFFAGFMLSFNGAAYAVIQSVVAPDMQGRVFTLISSAATAMSPLSLAAAGPLSDAFGVRFWYALAGVICTVMGVTALLIPAVVNLEDRARVEHEPVISTMAEAAAEL